MQLKLLSSRVDIPPFWSNNKIKEGKTNEQESAMEESAIYSAKKQMCIRSHPQGF